MSSSSAFSSISGSLVQINATASGSSIGPGQGSFTVSLTSTPSRSPALAPLDVVSAVATVVKAAMESGTPTTVPADDTAPETQTTMSSTASSSAGTAQVTTSSGSPIATGKPSATVTTAKGTSPVSQAAVTNVKHNVVSAPTYEDTKSASHGVETSDGQNAKPTEAKAQAGDTVTSQKVTVVSGTKSVPTGTSTIVDQPSIDSTLAQPVISTMVSNGQSFTVTPNLVTAMSTSTAPDGSYLTFTHVAANPTGLGAVKISENSSFFDNTAKTAGVFTAVGIVFSLVVIGLLLLCRRQRRARKQRRWIGTMKAPPAEDPFSDHASPTLPIMRTVSVEHDLASRRNTLLDEQASPMDPHSMAYGQMNYGTSGSSNGHGSHKGTFGKPLPAWTGAAGVHEKHPASGRSTPSVYPPSQKDDDDSFYTHSLDEDDAGQDPVFAAPASTLPPPRPARSILRDTTSRPIDLVYMTPSPSQSSNGGSVPGSPVDNGRWKVPPVVDEVDEEKELRRRSVDEIFSRPTLLGVRPRPSREQQP